MGMSRGAALFLGILIKNFIINIVIFAMFIIKFFINVIWGA